MLNVLHLPLNIASQMSATVRALRDLGVAAQGIVWGNAITQEAIGLRQFQALSRAVPEYRRYPVRLRDLAIVLRAIMAANVVHWHFATPALPFALDVKVARHLGKGCIVEFWGSDIRVPAIEAADNPYYAAIQNNNEYSTMESSELSRQRQTIFAGAAAIATTGMREHVLPALFTQVYNVRQRVYLADYLAVFPDPHQTVPLVIHSPTAPILKGTSVVLDALQKLAQMQEFDFQLVQGASHRQAKELLQRCDVYIDQVRGGSHGVAAVEAMAYGKPVICYLKPTVIPQYPPEIPIVNANPDNLTEVLASLLADSRLRHELGRRGRAYVEHYHDAKLLAGQLVQIYDEL